ncbi:MAG: MBL fold metallo-hydrolase [Euryarchaeota archaeon]|jgi:phosphoribosyl 1,2-cyclic phosphodiesterase|nr:MBL fold metallo-hydrolase [Euryarchaeota archaeon]|tara:strand:- start:771 stop:1601 length:831 start_codon:yes stop_codon:yes gene_type:complete
MIGVGLQITHLGSGSRGNCTLLESDNCKVLIDCGFSLKQTEKRLSRIEIEPSSIDAILITHHHGDHSRSALKASQKWDAKLYCNIETAIKMGWNPILDCRTFGNLERININEEISVLPIPIPHDDAENIALIVSNGDGNRAGFVTDLGEATVELKRHLKGCAHISIEANYDHSKLMQGPYPDSLKRRITSRGGHLSNSQTAEILNEVMTPELKTIVLCHLSDKNNAPHLAESEVLMRIGEEYKGMIFISEQSGPEFKIVIGEKNLETKIMTEISDP